MRFVELSSTPDGVPFVVHPRITWLRGLGPAARVSIVGLAHDMAIGEPPDWCGVVDIDGKTLRLDEAVASIGETAQAALIVDAASLPPVVDDHPTDDPPHESHEDADRDLDVATRTLAELSERIEELAEELASSGTVRADMNASLVSAQARADLQAADRLDRADGALQRAARRRSVPDPWSGTADPAGRIAELGDLIARLDETLERLPSGDRPALAAAVTTARAVIARGPVPCPEAAALSEIWTTLHHRRSAIESRVEASGGGTKVVAARLEEARAGAQVAKDAATPRYITPEEADRVERLHEAVLEAEQRAARGLRKGAGRADFEEAEAELYEALDALGHPTWAAFRMGNGLVPVPETAQKAFEQAQVDLEVAESEWAELMARLEGDTELQDVLAEIDATRERARALLGPDAATAIDRDDADALAAALREITIDSDTVDIDRENAIARLRDALASAGAAGHEEVKSEAALVALGDSWLKVLRAADEAALRIRHDRERAVEELDVLQHVGDTPPTDDELRDEREAVRSAERDTADSRDALAEVVQARMRLHVLAATEVNLAEEHDERLVQREGAQLVVDLAERRRRGTASADAATALADRVPRGRGGAIPVVVVMGDAPADVLDRLVALPDDVQVLVIGEGTGTEEWLERVGPDLAAAVDLGTLV